ILVTDAGHLEAASIGLHDGRQDADRRRFPRTIGSQEAEQASGFQRERQSAQRLSRSVGLLQAFGHQDVGVRARWSGSVALAHMGRIPFTGHGFPSAPSLYYRLLFPNRRYRLGTTNRLSNVDVIRPPRITIA